MKTKRITEDYVKMIYQLSQKGEVRCCRLAERLSVSRPTVSVSIKALSEEGLVYQDDFKNIHLTEQGLKLAREVEARHRVLYEGNPAQFTPGGSGGVSRQNFLRYFPKMLDNPPRIVCAFWFISQKIFRRASPPGIVRHCLNY